MEKEKLWRYISGVRKSNPLVHNITNYVVMNNTANALLAAGASPVMAHAVEEVAEMTGIAGALVINIGTLDAAWLESMKTAAEAAQRLGKPWVLDPVGAGATSYRNFALTRLLGYRPTVIRGNASEILAMAQANTATTKGVDSTRTSGEAIDAAGSLSELFGSVVCVSGATDWIIDGKRRIGVTNGDPMMTRVTGLGCTASALIGAFLAVTPAEPFEATVAAMALLGVAGELAAAASDGPGSLQLKLLDTLYTLGEDTFLRRAGLEIGNVR